MARTWRKIQYPPTSDPRRFQEIAAVVKAVHVVPAEGAWRVSKTGYHGLERNFETREEAVEFARDLSRRRESDLIIHDRDGKVSRLDHSPQHAPALAG